MLALGDTPLEFTPPPPSPPKTHLQVCIGHYAVFGTEAPTKLYLMEARDRGVMAFQVRNESPPSHYYVLVIVTRRGGFPARVVVDAPP